ncbi:MAG: hypothetical protein WAT30_04665, partial [Lactococcus raffinolactis]
MRGNRLRVGVIFMAVGMAGYVPAHDIEGMLDQQNLALLKTVVDWLLTHQSSVRWKQYLKM